MPPKAQNAKPGDKKAGGAQVLLDDDYADLATLPALNNYVFATLPAFKYKRNLHNVYQQLLKLYQFAPEDPMSQKVKVIQREDLITYAKLKQYISEEEGNDIYGKIGIEKATEVLAKTANDIIMSFEVAARRNKRDALQTQSNIDQSSNSTEVETTIWLKDFPQSSADFKAFYAVQSVHKLSIHSVYLLEEKFLPENEDEEILKFSSSDPTMERYYQEQERKRIEEKRKVEFLSEERIAAFNTALELGKLFTSSPSDSELRQCSIEKVRFQGPDSGTLVHDDVQMDSKNNVIMNSDPEDEHFFVEFAHNFKKEQEQNAKALQGYRALKKQFKSSNPKPLMPYPEEILKKQREEEERQKELLRKQEEEKKAQELLLQQQQQAAQKKGAPPAKQPIQQPAALASTKSKENLHQDASLSGQQQLGDQQQKQEYKPLPKSRDDEEKEWSFPHLEKAMAELPQEHGTVGNILAAMVYQISNQANKNTASNTTLNDDSNNKNSSQALTEQDKQFILKSEELENDLNDYFDDMFNKLVIEHNIKETTFQHQPPENLIINKNKGNLNNNSGGSPYQSLFNENDKINKLAQTYTFLNGNSISQCENSTLQKSQLPGINNRLGMPSQPSVAQPQRESDLAAVLSFSAMPSSQARRTLLLHACEQMFKQQQAHPERDFYFKDRNFVEKFDATTLRQIISQALRFGPELVYHYDKNEDALLLGVYYKNPPGRLLRRQWTAPLKVFPDYQVWKQYIKNEPQLQQSLQQDLNQLYDIESSKVGILRTNTKYCFPCDNSIIRIDKHIVGNRRIGSSLIVKDNLVFGLRESQEKFKDKNGIYEDEVLNREAWAQSDRRCNFWLEFENGVKILVEMNDKQHAHVEEIPLHEPLPSNMGMEHQIYSSMNQGGDGEDHRSPSVQVESVVVGAKSIMSKNASQKSLKAPPAAGVQSVTQSVMAKQNQPHPTTAQTKNTQQNAQSSMVKSDSAKSLNSNGSQGPSPQELALIQKKRDEEQRLLSAASKQQFFQDSYDPTVGSKITFTFQEGLIVQILPNGDVSQQLVENPTEKKKYGGTLQQDSTPAYLHEKSRLIMKGGQVVRYFLDGNMQIYYPDGTITTTDKRKGVWFTVNSKGVKRVRKLQENLVYDEPKRLKITEKVDPETSAHIQVREDGVLVIKYLDESRLVMMPDGTQILTKKNTETGSGTITIITKEGFAPVRLIHDPVKARAKTVIGLGGADSMMGIENIMERSNNGKVTEILLPDKTVIQSYQERQEMEGYNQFTTNMVHLIKREDFSIIKVRQDGELVLISANQRAFLNKIGKQKDFGVNDYDHFFELFGIAQERRSGVFTVNLDQGRIITQDEEGNVFIVYANGDSVEKLSVSFNLDQMVEGIEKKEPESPRIKDGEFIEEECKFLPPPKTIAHPRLFLIKNDIGYEFFNKDQLEYLFRCVNKDKDLIVSRKQVTVNNEEAISHMFLRKTKRFDPNNVFNHLIQTPKIPQSVELVNQTVSIPKEPVKEEYLWRNILEYKGIENKSQKLLEFKDTLNNYQQMRQRQKEEKERLKVIEIKSEEHKEQECKIWLRIAREKGIDISNVIGEEYKPLKDIVNEEKKQKFFDDLDKFNSDNDQN